jgi:methionine-rich copper-binding protein CopC
MKSFSYQDIIKRFIFISFVLVLVGMAYADTSYGASLNSTNTTNITDPYQTTNLNQTNQTDPTNLTPTNNSTSISPTIKSTGTVKVQSVTTVQNIQGIFINPADTPITSINPTKLKSEGITDIFVYTTRSNPSALGSFITKFAGTGIKVYAWVEAFKDFNGVWFNPGSNSKLETKIIQDITSIATNYNVNGVMLDYLRYSGVKVGDKDGIANDYPSATANVDYFASQIRKEIDTINNENILGKHKILLSSALMPEGQSNAYYYGQNYTQLSNYLDFLSPMIYVGNYKEPASWIGTTVKYIESHANGKPVVAILETYGSDSNPKPISTSQLDLDIKTAVNNGSDGYELFRYGLISSGFTGYAVVPKIVSINPANKAVNVKKNQVIKVTFNKSVKAGSLWIELIKSNGTSIPLTFTINGKVLTINHPVLSYGTYSLLFHTGSITDLTGNKLAGCRFSFTVNKIVPKVVSTYPTSNAHGVSLTSPITIKFCENILAGVNYSKIYVKNLKTGKVVGIRKTISGNTLTIKQSISRLANDSYEVVIPSAAVKDINGNNLKVSYIFKFKAV